MRPCRLTALLLLTLAALCAVPALALFDEGDTGLGGGDAPIAQNLRLDTYKNVAVTGTLSAALPGGGEVNYRVTKHPARGALTFDREGGAGFTYTPYANKTGKDAFTYVALDSQGRVSQPATVEVTITKPAVDVFYQDMAGHPAHKAAISLAERGVFTGERLGGVYVFRPEASVTRQEFLTMAMAAAGQDCPENSLPTGFSDGDAIAVWARPYVAAALREGAVRGESAEARFDPDRPIRQGEAAVILNRLLRVSDVTAAAEGSLPAWAAQSVRNLEAAGILTPGGDPDETLTRAEAAVLLDRAMGLIESRK